MSITKILLLSGLKSLSKLYKNFTVMSVVILALIISLNMTGWLFSLGWQMANLSSFTLLSKGDNPKNQFLLIGLSWNWLSNLKSHNSRNQKLKKYLHYTFELKLAEHTFKSFNWLIRLHKVLNTYQGKYFLIFKIYTLNLTKSNFNIWN